MSFVGTLSLLSILAVGTQTDTTVRVRPGTRLDVNNYGGEIAVQTWPKNAIRVEATHSDRVRVELEDSGSNVEVRAVSRRGLPMRIDYRITVPTWMPLHLSGIYTDVTVNGTRAEIAAETVKGDVNVVGGVGYLKLSSIEGMVDISDARGRLELSSVNQGVNITDVEGDVQVEAVNGDVVFDRVNGKVIEATTVNGDVNFIGQILEGGTYRFASHNGDLTVAIPDQTNASVAVATFNGEFESTFPVRISETRRDRSFNFVLGNGSAKIELETFEGAINLRRLQGLERRVQRAVRRTHVVERMKEMQKQKEEKQKEEFVKWKEK